MLWHLRNDHFSIMIQLCPQSTKMFQIPLVKKKELVFPGNSPKDGNTLTQDYGKEVPGKTYKE